MAALPKELLFAGIRGHVIALDKVAGTERWRLKLKGTEFVHLVTDGALLYASTRGEVFAVDPATGTLLWRNPMKGLGLGLVALLGSQADGGQADLLLNEASRQAARRRQAAAAAG
jgi:outer membrane protein assembly factor BamB